ncbi:hypothetical protein HWV62_12406 [Athelia sp. TMB]|nr:hypothetical protein HWV62_12406 [Athelia sp. TMB]
MPQWALRVSYPHPPRSLARALMRAAQTRSGLNYAGAFLPPTTMRTGRSFVGSARRAFDRDDAGLDSPLLPATELPPLSPSRTPPSPATPLSDADSLDAPPSILSSPSLWSGGHPLTAASVESLPSDTVDLPPESQADLYSEGGWLSESGYSSVSEFGAASEWEGSSEYASEPELVGDAACPHVAGRGQDAPAPPRGAKRKRKRTASDGRSAKKHKQRKRQAAAEGRGPTDLRAPSFCGEAASMPTALDSKSDMPACSTGFTALRLESLNPGKIWSCEELRMQGFGDFKWDGRKPVVILDDEDRIVAVLVGRPLTKPGEPDNWEQVVAGLEKAIAKLKRSCTFRKGDKQHRRGPHPARAFGISHGGGQTHPSVLALQTPANERAFRRFRDNHFVKRVAGFGSSAFSHFAPKLYSRYCDYFTRLLNHDAALKAGWSFDNSIFPTTTVNFGPNAVCFDHLDFANAAAGWCAITSTGNYDPTRGGHLVLFDIDTIVEFPPGSTILIPSSVMRHGNTPIQAGETRAGITQYAAGALFRWVDNGFMKAESTSDEVKARMAAEAPQRFNNLLGLYSTLDSLAADAKAVFGK